MLHIVPILCLILFIGLVEYRLKKHLDEINERINKLERLFPLAALIPLSTLGSNQQKEKESNENSSNE